MFDKNTVANPGQVGSNQSCNYWVYWSALAAINLQNWQQPNRNQNFKNKIHSKTSTVHIHQIWYYSEFSLLKKFVKKGPQIRSVVFDNVKIVARHWSCSLEQFSPFAKKAFKTLGKTPAVSMEIRISFPMEIIFFYSIKFLKSRMIYLNLES